VKINNIIGTEKNLKLDSTIAIKKSNDFIWKLENAI
jgi:hypothetical protein